MPRRIPLALAMIGAVSLLCWQATQGAEPKDEMLELYGLFVDAVEKVEANYVRPVSRRELLETALEGMLQQLDPHSTYFSINKLTVASYYRPSGENIHRFRNAKPTDQWGVKPDKGYEVKLSTREYIDWFRARRDRCSSVPTGPLTGPAIS